MPTQDQITNGQEKKQETSSGSEKYDFRKTNWGMNKEQVKATEGKKPDVEANALLKYKVNVDGRGFSCYYNFLEDKLYSCIYLFTGEHTDKNLYIDDYAEIKETLTYEYGKPELDISGLWTNNLYKGDRSHWGFAIGVGHVTYGATWETPTTEIMIMLVGANSRIRLIIGYDSKELKEWAKQIQEK
jgi:hypothetical protein